MTDAETLSSLTWRNEELKSTDWVIQLNDHPERYLYRSYRQRLRDWPQDPDFPLFSSRPTLQ